VKLYDLTTVDTQNRTADVAANLQIRSSVIILTAPFMLMLLLLA